MFACGAILPVLLIVAGTRTHCLFTSQSAVALDLLVSDCEYLSFLSIPSEEVAQELELRLSLAQPSSFAVMSIQ